MNYTEPVGTGNQYRSDYLNDLERLVARRQRQFKEESLRSAERFQRPEPLREQLIRTLGWPLTEYSAGAVPVQKKLVTVDAGVSVYRLSLEAMSGFRFYGILFVREDGKARPLIIAQHGGDGTPELCASLEPGGSSNYNDMVQRLLRQNVNVFAPQLLLWNEKKYFPAEKNADLHRHQWDNRLKQCGGSITALEIYCIRKSIDYFVAKPYVQPEQIGMAGLSYGGFYTLYTAAAEPRIKAALSCSFFNDRGFFCWNDWVFRSDQLLFDPEIAMLCHPRPLYLAVGEHDPLFQSEPAKCEAQRLRELSLAAYGSDSWYEFRVFDGYHEFIKDDELILKMIRDLRGERAGA